MNRVVKPIIITTVIVFFAIALMPFAAGAQRGALKEILHRMDRNVKRLKSLKADLRMEKYNSQLRESDVYTGTAIYLARRKKRPLYGRIDWSRPVLESFVVVGDKFEIYRPRLKQRFIGTMSSVRSKVPYHPLAFLNMTKKQIMAGYVITYVGDEKLETIPTWHIELKPKAQASYNLAELWIDASGMPLKARVTDISKDTTTVFLSNVRKNTKVDATVFKLSIPKGVTTLRG
jgi:outer membrane lipoprotein-sorting protein